MKIDFKELKKALAYIEKHSDQGKVEILLTSYGSVKDQVILEFNNVEGEPTSILIPADERAFSKITKTERF